MRYKRNQCKIYKRSNYKMVWNKLHNNIKIKKNKFENMINIMWKKNNKWSRTQKN